MLQRQSITFDPPLPDAKVAEIMKEKVPGGLKVFIEFSDRCRTGPESPTSAARTHSARPLRSGWPNLWPIGVFFAGEAMNPNGKTIAVHGASESAYAAVEEILGSTARARR